MKTKYLSLLALCACLSFGASAADTLKVSSFRYVGPLEVVEPYMVDEVGTNGKKFDIKSVLDAQTSLEPVRTAAYASQIAAAPNSLHLLGFSVQNLDFAKVRLVVEGLDGRRVFVDGARNDKPELSLDPGTHEIVLKYFSADAKAVTPKIGLVPVKGGELTLREDGRRLFDILGNNQYASCGGISISAGGKYATVTHSLIDNTGRSSSYTELIQLSDGKVLASGAGAYAWMPEGDCYTTTRTYVDRRDLVMVDPATGAETVLCRNVPAGRYSIVPGGRYLIYSMTVTSPREGEVHQILTPEDRQGGWRNRSYLARFDIATGMMQQITFGYNNSRLADISPDGSKILFSSSKDRYTARPTSLSSLYIMDISTLKTECLVEDDGFIGSSRFSPDGTKVLISGSPECLGGIGNVTPAGKIPSMTETELYVLNLADRSVKPITRDFDPNISSSRWSRYDGKIYVTTEDKDLVDIWRIDPVSCKAEKIPVAEENVGRMAIASSAPTLVYCGQGLRNGDRVYTLDTKKLKGSLLRDVGAESFADVDFCQSGAYEFKSRLGDDINCFYLLPPDFDASKKYPMVVFYYGGCSPSSRYLTGRYAPQMYASQGFVFLVVNPSGATGFGQEWSSRHVNTAGDVVADDIIEAVKRFCADNSFVDASKVGCIGASYGGFMTQYLLTRTDIFATGISHAGISDHTSYWGEGYWGYSYSETSMAESYPWNRKDLYVEHSPLYLADRIKTPLLFLHGSVDTNVPPGESIQMFTALKLLGVDTAFVMVDGENHHVEQYNKRIQWMRTIFAWFSKYLKDDPTWWDEMYPPKTL